MLAYFDCFSGISGDMTLGALIDLGVPAPWLQETLTRDLPLEGFDLEIDAVTRHSIGACRVEVVVAENQPARNYAAIRQLIEKSRLSQPVKERSLEIFKRLAIAEAGIHRCPVESVHFHEVGGVDALVDIVGAVLGLDFLGIRKVIASRIPTGTGFITASHGRLPVPAPATLALLKGVPIYGSEISHELVTPTGAAILTTLAESFEPLPAMRVEKIGYGAGRADLKEVPNVLRVLTGTLPPRQDDVVSVVETNIDDMNPEIFGYLMEKLFDDGALDVFWVPVIMKKNRPGTMVKVICRGRVRDAVIARLLTETTTAGVRYCEMQRRLLEREQVKIATRYGEIAVKRIETPDGAVRLVPEYDTCRKIALEKNIPLRWVYETIVKEAGAG